MPALKLNLSQTLLFVVLLYASPSCTLPVKPPLGDDCVRHAEEMRVELEKASTNGYLHRGINMDLSAEMKFTTQTLSVCRPTESRSTCSGETQLEYNETAVSYQSYEGRVVLAKVLNGFLVRAITMNRALSHMQATRQKSAL
ncbi:hypothetical protein CRUP_017704 [Coryphaenoides rupestris]|nr:hypothetical protein CRUP_017704 [Coryphaenoides rupestris]